MNYHTNHRLNFHVTVMEIGRYCSVRWCSLFNRRTVLGSMVVVYIFWCGRSRLGPAHNHNTNEENSKEIYMGQRATRRDDGRGLVAC